MSHDKYECPDCGSENTDIEEDYQDCYSYGGGVRSEGHYTIGTGTFTGKCSECECEFTLSSDGDGLHLEEVTEPGNVCEECKKVTESGFLDDDRVCDECIEKAGGDWSTSEEGKEAE
jgi:hypothetical protein